MSTNNKTFTRPKDILLNDEFSNKELVLCEPNKWNDNFYGSLGSKEQLFRNDSLEFYKNDLKNVSEYNIQSLKLNRGDILDAFKNIDQWMLDNKEQIEEKTQLSNLSYRPLVREWVSKAGNHGCSSEIRFLVKKEGAGYHTIFFDEDNNEIKFKNFEDLEKQVGYKTSAKVRLILDYQVIPRKNEYSVLPKIKFIQLQKDTNSGPTVDPELLALKVNEIDLNTVKPNISLVKGEEEMTKGQKFMRIFWGEKPGKRFRFENFTIDKHDKEDIYVGLAGKEYENNKITVIMDGANLEFLNKIDEVIREKLPELRDGFELTKKTQKLEYVDIVNKSKELPLVKFTIDMNPEKRTKFYVDKTLVEWESIDDLRKHITLGTEFKNPNIILSKISYIAGKKEAYVQLKLKSCTLIPSKSSRTEYVNSGKFDDTSKESNDEELC
jgi:hypothetical protein